MWGFSAGGEIPLVRNLPECSRAGRERGGWKTARGAAGRSSNLVRKEKARYYMLIDLIFGSRWNLQRYLTRITQVLSGDSHSGKVPFGQQSALDLEPH